MKLIFNIFKKVRDLKEEEMRLQKKIKEREIRVEKNIKDAWEEFDQKRKVCIDELRDREDRLKRREEALDIRENLSKEEIAYTRANLFLKEKEDLKNRTDYLDQREKEFDQRGKDLNELQQKINDQILKLGILKGVNK